MNFEKIKSWSEFFCFHKKFLVLNLLQRNLKNKYRRSIFGLFWTLLNPLALSAIYYIVFKKIIKVQTPHYLPFVLTGTLFWSFFTQSASEGMGSIVNNIGLISKVNMPLQVFSFTGVLTNFITFTMSMPVIFISLLISDIQVARSFLFLPIYLIALLLLSYSFAFIFGVCFVFFRDLQHLLGLIFQIWFYTTPIIYEESLIPKAYSWALYLNPLGGLFAGMHQILIHSHTPDWSLFASMIAWVFIILLVAQKMSTRFLKEIIEKI